MSEVADPGVQLERSALAWRRTALAFAVNAGLLVKAGAAFGTAALISALVAAAACTVLWVAAERGYRSRRGTTAGMVVDPRGAAALAVLTIVLSAAVVLS
jgi:uncharacterized membrane protein YidH (DUF202 family)